MIQGKTRKIMIGGIQKFANEINETPDHIQINISFDTDGSVKYLMCQNWQPKRQVDFKYILNKKIDMLGMEQICTPFLHNSLVYYSQMHETKPEDISVFVFARNTKIWLAVYNKTDNVQNVDLSGHFEKMGM